MALFGRTVVDNLLFLGGEVLEGDVRADSHFPGDILHQRPHQVSPWSYGSFVDCEGVVGYESRFVHGADNARAAAAAACAFAVEGQLLGSGGVDTFAADRAVDGLLCRYVQGRLQIVSVGAAVAGKAREHQSQAVEELGHGAESAPDTRHAGPLMKRERRRHIAHIVGKRP